MTCFWLGLIKALTPQKIKNTLNCQPKPVPFIQKLKELNTKDISVKWQNTPLSEKQLEENFEHIRDYKIQTVSAGYWCSTCDPFLILICHIFKVNIAHRFNNTMINYTINEPKTTLRTHSNRGHFWA